MQLLQRVGMLWIIDMPNHIKHFNRIDLIIIACIQLKLQSLSHKLLVVADLVDGRIQVSPVSHFDCN